MEPIFVVTDSTADIPKELAKQLGITVVPLKVHISNETYLDGETLTAEEFYQKLQSSDDLPTTSQPSPMDFVETYKKLANGKPAKIISIHLSAALSGTVQSAQLAKTMVEELGIDVRVFDSKKASYSIGIIVVGVAKALQEGKNFEELLNLTNDLIARTQVYFMVDTLTYLQKGGRIGKAASLFGTLLNIKPILSLNEQGEVFAVDKVRGQKKAISKILGYLTDYAKDQKVVAGISHASNLEEAKNLEGLLREKMNIVEFVMTDIGPVIGTHVGPGTLAVMMYTV
ncbi:DegV family protein [Tepidibacillus fermentans]|uniref:DegV family protein with EDD domain n=1 Tax=Tepidibacillus fermentans TaxID=1281767 RepID=A0A4R3KKL3_9BACI|nr:DegV family protein [Tepidibacillus fermentans]TCS84344.1 DegV family protein with EDD domain [Tepidibacillus fermentans]